jgi:hypothetical protein
MNNELSTYINLIYKFKFQLSPHEKITVTSDPIFTNIIFTINRVSTNHYECRINRLIINDTNNLNDIFTNTMNHFNHQYNFNENITIDMFQYSIQITRNDNKEWYIEFINKQSINFNSIITDPCDVEIKNLNNIILDKFKQYYDDHYEYIKNEYEILQQEI